MKKTRGLGRGLSSLIPTVAASSNNEAYKEVDLKNIVPSPWQPRKNFANDKLEELAQSIAEQGLVQPLIVRANQNNYELVAGERRFRALQLLNWEKAPVVIIDASDAKMRELALVENLQRADLNPLEIAHAYNALIVENNFTHEKVAEKIGVSRVQVTNTLRLLELPEEVKQLVSENQLSAGHARTLLTVDDPLTQINLAKKVIAETISVRELEKITSKKKQSNSNTDNSKTINQKPPHILNLEERLIEYLQTKVTIEDKDNSGKIVIEYYSLEDASRLLNKLGLPVE